MSERARATTIRVIRIFLAVVFIAYGVVKLFGGQFYYGDWTIAKRTADGPFLVWAFFGYSPVYGRFIGFCELIPALMLLVPRTATVGAAALFAVSLNITVMDFAFGFPSVKYMAALYTLLAAALLWFDRAKLLALLADDGSTVLGSPLDAVRRTRARLSRPVAVTGYAVLALFLLFVANLVATALDRGPEAPAAAEVVTRRQLTQEPRVLRSRYTGLFGIGRTATVDLLVPRAGAMDTVRVRARKASGFSRWVIERIEAAQGRAS